MDKTEFINTLRKSLSGNVSADILNDNIRYYEDYIHTQIRLGYKEKEVMEKLGDPRLIAKTIINTYGTEQSQTGAGHGVVEEETSGAGKWKFWESRKWKWLVGAVIAIAIVVLALWLFFSLLMTLLPYLLIIGAIFLLMRLGREWMKRFR